jgi:hypothetical protein
MTGFSTHWNEKRVTLAVFFLLHQDLFLTTGNQEAQHYQPIKKQEKCENPILIGLRGKVKILESGKLKLEDDECPH